MKTIIAGSRNINSLAVLRDAIKQAERREGIIPSLIVSGCAKGVDTNGEDWSREQKLPLIRMPALWGKYGKSAGRMRNIEMADYAEALIAVWDGESKGTKHMIDTARYKGLKVYILFLNKPTPMWEHKPTPEQAKINNWPH